MNSIYVLWILFSKVYLLKNEMQQGNNANCTMQFEYYFKCDLLSVKNSAVDTTPMHDE